MRQIYLKIKKSTMNKRTGIDVIDNVDKEMNKQEHQLTQEI